jgi:vitamin B12 transporter
VLVRGFKPEHFMVGYRLIEMDSSWQKYNQSTQLSEFLSFFSPAVFRISGAGQLSTIGLRGTSAQHTAVVWNGININSPSLGLSDFSTLPLIGADQIKIQMGSTASVVGSDAIGGSILMQSQAQAKSASYVGWQWESNQNLGAQLNYVIQKKLSKNWTLSSNTAVYGHLNQFKFDNDGLRTRRGEQLNTPETRQKQRGLRQDLFLEGKKGQTLSLNIWYAENDLRLGLDSNLRNTYALSKRHVLSYAHGAWVFRLAHIWDQTQYREGLESLASVTNTAKNIFKVERDFRWGPFRGLILNAKMGVEYNKLVARVDAYESGLKYEDRSDFYVLSRFNFKDKLSATLNMRQALVQGYNPPFAPALGIKYDFIQSKKWNLFWDASAGKAYRVPTLNERHWPKLGNSALKPENSKSLETGIGVLGKATKNLTYSLNARLFTKLVDNWVYWNPANNYKVENLQEVKTEGMEWQLGTEAQLGKVQAKLNLNYSFNSVFQNKEYGPYTVDIVGKQLIYIPKHQVGNNLWLKTGRWEFMVQHQFMSVRQGSFDHSTEALPALHLVHVGAAYRFKFNAREMYIHLRSQNVGNVIYADTQKFAMPTRTFLINFKYSINKNTDL